MYFLAHQNEVAISTRRQFNDRRRLDMSLHKKLTALERLSALKQQTKNSKKDDTMQPEDRIAELEKTVARLEAIVTSSANVKPGKAKVPAITECTICGGSLSRRRKGRIFCNQDKGFCGTCVIRAPGNCTGDTMTPGTYFYRTRYRGDGVLIPLNDLVSEYVYSIEFNAGSVKRAGYNNNKETK